MLEKLILGAVASQIQVKSAENKLRDIAENAGYTSREAKTIAKEVLNGNELAKEIIRDARRDY